MTSFCECGFVLSAEGFRFLSAKVPPQRQIATHQVADIQRDNVSVVGGQATLTQQQQQQAASLFLQQQQQQHRGSPVTAVSSSSADTRPGAPLERVPAAPAYAHPAAASFPAAAATAVNPGSSDLNAYYQHAVYQNLMYNPQLAAAQAQAFTSLAGGTTIRPSGIGEFKTKRALPAIFAKSQ